MTRRTPVHNSTLAIGGVSSPLDSFVVAESSVLRTNFCAKKPAHRQSANPYRQALQEGTLIQKEGILYILFEKPQRGITPGQFAAWYQNDELIGSGIIAE
jgi:tRNA U34 2-thiouridine synthase MnmA/TrmU